MSTDCTICTEEIQKNDNNNYVLPCAHVFHPICIRTWLDTSNICPICKHPVNIYTNDQLERYNQRQEALNTPEDISAQNREFVSTFINEYVYNIRRDINTINFGINNIANHRAAIHSDELPISSYYIESNLNNSIENAPDLNAPLNDPLNAPDLNAPDLNAPDLNDEPPPLEVIPDDEPQPLEVNPDDEPPNTPLNMPERIDPYLHVPELILPESNNGNNQIVSNEQVSIVLNYIYRELLDNNQLDETRNMLLQEIMYIFDRP